MFALPYLELLSIIFLICCFFYCICMFLGVLITLKKDFLERRKFMEEKIIDKLSRHEFLIVCIIELIMFFQCCLTFPAWLSETKNNIIGISLGTSLIVLFIFYIVYLKVNSFNNKKLIL